MTTVYLAWTKPGHRMKDMQDVTEDVQNVLDALHGSLDWGSGFLDEDQLRSAHKLMTALEFDCDQEYETDEVAALAHSFGHDRPIYRTETCAKKYGHEGEHGP